MRTVSVKEAALILGKAEEQVLRYYRSAKPRLKGLKEYGRVFFLRSEVEGLALTERKGKQFLQFSIFRELAQKVRDSSGNLYPIENWFGEDAGCLITLAPAGFPYGLALLFHLLEKGRDVILRRFGREEEAWEPDLLNDTRILLVDDLVRTGGALRKAKLEVQRYTDAHKIKFDQMKAFVYDFIPTEPLVDTPDFWVEKRDYATYLEDSLVIPGV